MTPIAPPRSLRFRRPPWMPGALGAIAASLALVATSCSSDVRPQAGSPSTTTAVRVASTSETTDPSVRPNESQPSESGGESETDSSEFAGLDPEEVNKLLIDAAWDNDIGLVGDLIAAGADVNYKDNTQQSAYLIATSEGYFELLEMTLANGADVASLDSFNGTGLIRAAERGHADIVGRLLQTGIDVNHINNLGWTALHESIILGDGDQRALDTVRLLVAGGSDVRIASQRDGSLPLDMATTRGQGDIAKTIQAVLDADGVADANRALLAASQSGDADAAAIALAAGADIESRDASLRTPLLVSVTNDRTDVARLLVALGADPDALDDRHDTPWLVTGVTGSVAMAEILLVANPDLAILNRFGGTSLIPASERGHLDYVTRVVQTDMDINHVNDLGWTALMEAVLFGGGSATHQEIISVLLAAGADPSIADKNGTTPTEHAESKGHDEIVQLLTDR